MTFIILAQKYTKKCVYSTNLSCLRNKKGFPTILSAIGNTIDGASTAGTKLLVREYGVHRSSSPTRGEEEVEFNSGKENLGSYGIAKYSAPLFLISE